MTNATNANSMKERNRRLIIDLIRHQELSRAEIAKRTSLTKAAVSIIVDELIKNEVVYEARAGESTIGRRPVCLKVNPDFMYAVGVDITRRNVRLGIIDISGRILCEKKFLVHPKKDALMNIKKGIEEVIAESGVSKEKIFGIGVTAPGPVDVQNTTILNPANFDEWHYENIGLRLKKAFNTEVYLENISGGIALCEKYFGVAKEMDDFMLLVVSDGIGSGIMNSGRLLRNVTELGHTSIEYNGRKCECGNCGCVEKYASIPSILSESNYKSWEEAVDAQDDVIIEKEAEYLSCALINAINLFGFESIVLEGEINYKAEKIIKAIDKRIKNNTMTKDNPKIISGSAFGKVLCAGVTVFDNYFNEV